MKKIMIIALAMITIQVSAQEKKKDGQNEMRKERTHVMEDMTAEEIANLQTKKMTLQLDLSEAQQKQIMAINIEEAKERKIKMEARKATKKEDRVEMTKEQRLTLMNSKLDRQIKMKAQMKQILNEEQFTKWENSLEKGKRSDRRSNHHGELKQ